MRQDARSLLELLGRRGFRYKEFADPFADMELWPIFEAMLTDERVVGRKEHSLPVQPIEIRSAAPASAPVSARVSAPARPSSTLFAHYGEKAGGQPAPPAAASGNSVNVRQFFGRLSDKSGC